MKQFLKLVFASCLGVILALGMMIFLGFVSISTLLSGLEGKPEAVKEGILRVGLESTLPELANNTDVFNFNQQESLGLQDILKSIEYAATDDKIKGISFEPGMSSVSFASATLYREALLAFKKSGKFVYSYSDLYTKNAYYIASVSDSIFLHPMGIAEINGFGTSVLFFTDFLKKVGVEMEIFSAGKFKSAVEPFKLNKMSPENKLQLRGYLEDLYSIYLEDISKSRNIETSLLHRMANYMTIRDAESALSNKIIDGLCQKESYKESLKTAMGLGSEDKLALNKIPGYFAANKLKIKPVKVSSDKIAIVYAEGEITDNVGNPGTIYPELYQETFEKIIRDNKVKAVVLRVNSPGGSALASDKILSSMQKIQQKGIPLVVSFGDYAASGGYYISCFADTIVAQPSSLTGSIGVFGLIPNATELMNNKLGFTLDSVKTSEYALGISPLQKMSLEEKVIVQQGVDKIYDRFISLVAEGRNLDKSKVDSIGQGRIWSGREAQEIGLVDVLGNLDTAVKIAAEMANTSTYRVVEYPFIKDPITRILESLNKENNADLESKLRQKALYIMVPQMEKIQYIKEPHKFYTRLPYLLEE
jgi:protease IV